MLEWLLTWSPIVWVVAFTAQLVDLQAALNRAAGPSRRSPIRALALVPAIAMPYFVGAVVSAVRLDRGDRLGALALLVALVLLAVLAGAVLAASARSRLRIESLLALVQESATDERLTPADVDDFEKRLRVHVAHPPASWSYGSLAYLARNPLRLLPTLVAIGVLVLHAASDHDPGWIVAGAVGAVVSAALAVAEARAVVAAIGSRGRRVREARREIEATIVELRKTTRKGATGLGDRVTRALQILRDQQG
jgi:hypothetical protein